jgi:hypothetical protein
MHNSQILPAPIFMPEKEIFTFAELSPAARDRAIESRRTYYDIESNDELTELFEQDLNMLGFGSTKVQYGLSYSQGDGVAFYGSFALSNILAIKNEDLTGSFSLFIPYLDAIRLEYAPIMMTLLLQDYPHASTALDDWSIEGGNSRYHHHKSMRVEFYSMDLLQDEYAQQYQEKIQALQDALQAYAERVSSFLEKLGYDEIESMQTDEYIAECMANEDLEFDEYGNEF